MKWITRRAFLALFAVTFLWQTQPAAAGERPEAFIARLASGAIENLTSPDLPMAERQARFRAMLHDGFLPPASCRLFRLVDDSRTALDHLIQLRQAVERFGGAKKQIAAWAQRRMNALENVLLHIGGKVDQYVTAEHDVELAQRGIAVEQILHPELDPRTDRGFNRPPPRRFDIEVALQAVAGQTTGNCQAVVFCSLAGRKHRTGQFGSHDLHSGFRLTGIAALVLIDGHRQRVGFLPGGTCRRPDSQTLPRPSLEHLWQYTTLEHFERVGVTKPERFVGRHSIDDQFPKPATWLCLNLPDQIAQRLDALLFHQLVQLQIHSNQQELYQFQKLQ